jgi:hypothetical protein
MLRTTSLLTRPPQGHCRSPRNRLDRFETPPLATPPVGPAAARVLLRPRFVVRLQPLEGVPIQRQANAVVAEGLDRFRRDDDVSVAEKMASVQSEPADRAGGRIDHEFIRGADLVTIVQLDSRVRAEHDVTRSGWALPQCPGVAPRWPEPVCDETPFGFPIGNMPRDEESVEIDELAD